MRSGSQRLRPSKISGRRRSAAQALEVQVLELVPLGESATASAPSAAS